MTNSHKSITFDLIWIHVQLIATLTLQPLDSLSGSVQLFSADEAAASRHSRDSVTRSAKCFRGVVNRRVIVFVLPEPPSTVSGFSSVWSALCRPC